MKRREFITFSLMASLWQAIPVKSEEASIPLNVFKDPNCGCCNKWVEILSKMKNHFLISLCYRDFCETTIKILRKFFFNSEL